MADEQAASQADAPVKSVSAAKSQDPLEKAAELRAEAARIVAAQPAPEGTTKVKVEAPHSEFHFAGVVVSSEYAPVSNLLLSRVQQAADAAGVTLTTEG